ncbi:hypothetical protein L6452_15915 [Arctium lappa]|uniref:Uncharacterized protein n=1 Tax=Arctium lappa TaxID=4217 RepID=A0ACB9CQ73_ARCLA|nr:hypothetical protein L6452_15915 [Arctium lappa]
MPNSGSSKLSVSSSPSFYSVPGDALSSSTEFCNEKSKPYNYILHNLEKKNKRKRKTNQKRKEKKKFDP